MRVLLIGSFLPLLLLSPAPRAAERRTDAFYAPKAGYAPENYHRKIPVLDKDRKTIVKRNADIAWPLMDIIRRAEKTIDIATYLFGTRTFVYDELIKANERGVKVRLFLDTSIKDDQKVPVSEMAIDALAKIRPLIEVKVLDPQKIKKKTGIAFLTMHEKFGIVDGRYAFNGSANIEELARLHYVENRYFFYDYPKVVRAFEEEFDRLWNEYGLWRLRAGKDGGPVVTPWEEISKKFERKKKKKKK